jgi:hypothetical protein
MKNVIVTIVVGLSMLILGLFLGRKLESDCIVCKGKKVVNRMNDGRFMVIPVDTVDGRPTYNVLFEDENGYDSMYAEEIANSLNKGKWEYNEMLKVVEEE